MKKLLVVALVFAIVGLAAAVASAQEVKNPTRIVVGVSPDHAQITRYELGWFMAGATEPVQMADIGTGTPVNGEIEKPLPSYPIGVTYTGKVRAWANANVSAWSVASNEFSRDPLPPVSVRAVK